MTKYGLASFVLHQLRAEERDSGRRMIEDGRRGTLADTWQPRSRRRSRVEGDERN